MSTFLFKSTIYCHTNIGTFFRFSRCVYIDNFMSTSEYTSLWLCWNHIQRKSMLKIRYRYTVWWTIIVVVGTDKNFLTYIFSKKNLNYLTIFIFDKGIWHDSRQTNHPVSKESCWYNWTRARYCSVFIIYYFILRQTAVLFLFGKDKIHRYFQIIFTLISRCVSTDRLSSETCKTIIICINI